jgi:hypothetical protein
MIELLRHDALGWLHLPRTPAVRWGLVGGDFAGAERGRGRRSQVRGGARSERERSSTRLDAPLPPATPPLSFSAVCLEKLDGRLQGRL